MRNQKLVKRERKADSEEKAKESEQCLWRKEKRKQNYRGEKIQLSIRKEEPVPCERGWRQAVTAYSKFS